MNNIIQKDVFRNNFGSLLPPLNISTRVTIITITTIAIDSIIMPTNCHPDWWLGLVSTWTYSINDACKKIAMATRMNDPIHIPNKENNSFTLFPLNRLKNWNPWKQGDIEVIKVVCHKFV